jgi:hypothetical protein
MALSDEVRKCVAFIGHGDEDVFKSCGTGFLLGYESSRYFVTAGHIARSLGDGPYSIRLNRKDGTSDTLSIDPLSTDHPTWFRWYFPNDPNVDLAVTPFDFSLWSSGYDVKFLPASDMVLSDARRVEEEIGPGDLCHAIGLFHLVQGKKRNVPVVHTGHIAMNCGEELISVQNWRGGNEPVFVNAYLVELNNLEGLSGAPVFVRSEFRMTGLEFSVGQRDVTLTDARLHLLGVWQGSWTVAARNGKLPVGIGVVTPASDLLNLLQQQDVVDSRANFNARIAANDAADLNGKANGS